MQALYRVYGSKTHGYVPIGRLYEVGVSGPCTEMMKSLQGEAPSKASKSGRSSTDTRVEKQGVLTE